ncbi:integrase core domain-containing protein, partial [Salinisphaera sp. S4-8]|uniref:integrase core domain-containing protein n=1 Tax=Salinisphaera sp. S4-8 TaxID=633357 RepID=UPI0033419C7A
RSYAHSEQRASHLPHWLHHYNWHRPHASLDYKTPISRLGWDVNNLVGLHT